MRRAVSQRKSTKVLEISFSSRRDLLHNIMVHLAKRTSPARAPQKAPRLEHSHDFRIDNFDAPPIIDASIENVMPLIQSSADTTAASWGDAGVNMMMKIHEKYVLVDGGQIGR